MTQTEQRNLYVAEKTRKTDQINAWVVKYRIIMRSLTDAEAARIAKLYHAAMAVDEAEAHAEDARRTFKAQLCACREWINHDDQACGG